MNDFPRKDTETLQVELILLSTNSCFVLETLSKPPTLFFRLIKSPSASHFQSGP
jgi:hypothetical protein